MHLLDEMQILNKVLLIQTNDEYNAIYDIYLDDEVIYGPNMLKINRILCELLNKQVKQV